jgi:tRNA nucleotidyltransferase/poly(A) polymerase
MPNDLISDERFSAYAGLWVALVRGEISAIGRNAEEARLASLDARPKETPIVMYVPEDSTRHLTLPPLFDEVRPAILAARPGTPLWLVGGSVRDGLLGRATHDLDFAVQGDALSLGRAVADRLGGAFYPLDQERGAGRVVLKREGIRYFLDFAALRAPDLPGDLARRDFTLNAMAAPLDDPAALIDPLGGEADLRARLIRACGPSSLRDDPVRGLRAVRLAAQFDFRLDKTTRQAIKAEAPGLARVSAERIRDEFMRLLGGRRPASAVRALDMLGLLGGIVPETAAMKGVAQSSPHVFDVWEHTLATLDRLDSVLSVLGPVHDPDAAADLALGLAAVRLGRFREPLAEHLGERLSDERPARWLLFLAALLHDAAKPATKSIDADGAIHFYRHEQAGAELAFERAGQLRLSGDEARRVRAIVEFHLRPTLLANESSGPSRRAMHRFFRAAGDSGIDVCLLSLADVLATWGPQFRQDGWARHTEVVAALLKSRYEDYEQVVRPAPLVTGRELMNHLGLKEGPLVGRLLEAILEAQAEGEVTDRAAALELARILFEQERD